MTVTWDITLWLDDIQPVDHEELGLGRLIWQYRGDKPRIQGFLSALLSSLQSLEDVSFQVLANRWPLTAEGVQLDTLGKIVGQLRGTLTDTQYRLFILARILVNKSKGRSAEIGYILETMNFPTIVMWEYYPAELHVYTAGADFGELVIDLLASAKAGGVLLRYTFSDEDDDDVFKMADTLGADDTAADSGFGDLGETTQTTGGYFAGGFIR